MAIDWENMSNFEINKAVAEKLGKVVLEIDDTSSLGMTSKYHEQHPDTVWVVDLDEQGQMASIHYQFNPCSDWEDAGPIIQENKISIIADSTHKDWQASWDFYDRVGGATCDDNPLKAAMITFLKMKGE